ncbi:MAG: VWA domain-containing protein [Burkholderiales bacterium]|nr:MAG: VWA domain-containing protein [Burkholderiales bacterium]
MRELRCTALEERLSALDALSRRLWLPAIVNTEGDPFARIDTLARWRARLLAGRHPCEVADHWPAADVAEAFGRRIGTLRLARLSQSQEEIADQVIRSVLWYIDRLAAFEARLGRAPALQVLGDEFQAQWQERSEDLQQVLRLFESLDGLASFAEWTRTRGLLRSAGWAEVLASSERIERLGELARLIERIGRWRVIEAPADAQPVRIRGGAATERQWVLRRREIEIPGAPIEIEGVRRSGELANLLPSEAAMMRLGSLRLRRLWAARLAEQAALTYAHRSRVMHAQWVESDGTVERERREPQPPRIAGPMVLCVDTSGSMSGAPEAIAKAVVLHAVRVARASGRPCHAVAFGGPQDVVELDLSSGPDLLERLTEFLGQSFGGGTDVVEPLARAVRRLESDGWRAADLLIATDGEFGVAPDTCELIDRTRASLGLRVTGVLIGDRETIGLATICDQVFWVRRWRSFAPGHGAVEPPVHDSRLTALYFPEALPRRPPPARQVVAGEGRARDQREPGRRDDCPSGRGGPIIE